MAESAIHALDSNCLYMHNGLTGNYVISLCHSCIRAVWLLLNCSTVAFIALMNSHNSKCLSGCTGNKDFVQTAYKSHLLLKSHIKDRQIFRHNCYLFWSDLCITKLSSSREIPYGFLPLKLSKINVFQFNVNMPKKNSLNKGKYRSCFSVASEQLL